MNVYKVNRAGLVPPAPSAGAAVQPQDTRSPSDVVLPHARYSRVWDIAAVVAGVVVLAVSCLLWFGRGRHQPAPEAARVPPVAPLTQGSAAAKTGLPNYRALVIGINQYAKNGGEGWQTLNCARADAEAVANTLSQDYGFQVHTLLDGEATRAAILNALDDLAVSGSDGADLIYFAGHGFFDEQLQEGYWIPADARKTVDGRQAKEDWLWNSTITRLINASRARHVLVLSDACYSGSLFRGDEALSSRGSKSWYERAIAKPSRYLITSGGLEPVLDSGAGHSVFAQQVINYLAYGDQNVFSANDLGLALRERVAALTGQMVQMGPLPVSGHAGGEFVFIRQKQGQALASLTPRPETSPTAGTRGAADEESERKARQTAIHDAVALTRAGAPKAANALVSVVLQQNAQDQLAKAVADYIARSTRQEGRDELNRLIEQVAAKGKAAAAANGASARPRVLACLGPVLPPGANPEAESAALLYRIALRSELEARAGLKVIEREALETVLQEQNVGVSDLADPRARLAIGKLLPASLLLMGDLIPSAKGERIFVRLVDTETTQVLSSFTVIRKEEDDQERVCSELAAKIAERIMLLKPLLAPVTSADGAKLRAELGTYHGVRPGLSFTVLTRTLRDKKVPDDFSEQVVGSATVSAVSDFSCDLDAVWDAGGAPQRAQDLWVRERAATAATTSPAP